MCEHTHTLEQKGSKALRLRLNETMYLSMYLLSLLCWILGRQLDLAAT